jgi:hypothetical protein
MSQPLIVYFVRHDHHDHPAIHLQRALLSVVQVIQVVVKPSLISVPLLTFSMSERQPLLRNQDPEESGKPRPTPVPWRQLIVVCLIRVGLAFIPISLRKSLQWFKAQLAEPIASSVVSSGSEEVTAIPHQDTRSRYIHSSMK